MNHKILHINTADMGGGAETVVMQILKNVKYHNHLIVKQKKTSSPMVTEFTSNIGDQLYIALQRILYKAGYRGDLKTYFSITEELNQTYNKLKRIPFYKEASIIHLHNIHRGFFDLDALYNIGKEKKIIWTLHDMWPLTGGEVHTFDDYGFKIGNAITPYNQIYPLDDPLFDRRQYYMNFKKILYDKLGSQITFVAVSEWMKRNIEDAFVISTKNQIKLIYNCVDSSVFRNNKLRCWEIPRILFFNSANSFKASDLFLSIVDEIKSKFHLNVVGIPFEHENVRFYIPKVDDPIDLINIYNDSDILIFPSRAENFPLTILEAMSCGVCVIASNVGGIPEAIHSKHGYLFENNNKKDMLNKLESSLVNLSDSRLKGALSSEIVNRRFDIKVMISQYEEIYNKLSVTKRT